MNIKDIDFAIEMLSHPQSGDESDINEALVIALKSLKAQREVLEQETILDKSILDKIITEIEQGYCVVNNDYDHGRNYGLYMATQVIDKYKTKSIICSYSDGIIDGVEDILDKYKERKRIMENITKAIGNAVMSFVILAPIFLLATSIFYKRDFMLTMLFAVITSLEWLFCTTTIYMSVNRTDKVGCNT